MNWTSQPRPLRNPEPAKIGLTACCSHTNAISGEQYQSLTRLTVELGGSKALHDRGEANSLQSRARKLRRRGRTFRRTCPHDALFTWRAGLCTEELCHERRVPLLPQERMEHSLKRRIDTHLTSCCPFLTFEAASRQNVTCNILRVRTASGVCVGNLY